MDLHLDALVLVLNHVMAYLLQDGKGITRDDDLLQTTEVTSTDEIMLVLDYVVREVQHLQLREVTSHESLSVDATQEVLGDVEHA